MNIAISNRSEDYGIDTYVVTIENFKKKAFHPFIASSKWDNFYIDICDEMPRGIIRQVLSLGSIKVRVLDKDNMSTKVMQLLCEVFPDDAAKLRNAFLNDKVAFRELVDTLTED